MSEEVGEALEYSNSIIEEGDEFVTQEATATEEPEAQQGEPSQEDAASTEESSDEFDEALSALDNLLGEENQEEEVKADAEEADAPKEGRANRRIRGLNSDLKQAQDANIQMQHQMQQLQTQYAQQQQEAQQRFLDALQGHNQQEVDPATELRQDLVNQTTAKLNPELTTLKNELNSLKGNMQREAEEAQATAKRQEYIRDADIATKEVFFGNETDDINAELQEGLSTMTMMYQWLTGAEAKDAAQMAKRTALQYAKAELGRQGKAMKAKRQASLETESPAPQGKSNVSGDTSPSLETLRQNGFTDELDWAINGSPTLNS